MTDLKRREYNVAYDGMQTNRISEQTIIVRLIALKATTHRAAAAAVVHRVPPPKKKGPTVFWP